MLPRFLGLAALVGSAAPVTGQLPPTTIITDTVVSRTLGEARPVRIALPKDYDRTGAAYHVVYALDGNASVEYTIGIAETLYQSGYPRLIVVAVPSTRRTRDLTPSRSADAPAGGGADAFLAFLGDELVPWVERRFRTTGFRVLVGHSLGGLFNVHAVTYRPALFDAHVAISPSVFLNNDFALAAFRRFLARGAAEAELFVAMGHEPGEEGDGIVRLWKVLEAEAPPSLRWTFRAYEAESHSSVPVPATMDGLRWVFRGYEPPAAVLASGLEALIAHYAAAGDRYGVTIQPPQRVLVNLGSEYLTAGDTVGAIAVFEHYARIYPRMTLPLGTLADVYLAAGEPCRARDYLDRILVLSPGSLDAQRRRESVAAADCS